MLRKWHAQLMLGEKNIGQRSIVEGPRQTSTQQPMPVVQYPHYLVQKAGQNCQIVEEVGQKEKNLGRHGFSSDDI